MTYVLMVPSMAVTALYHGKTTPAARRRRSAFVAEATAFAINEYLPALMKGTALVGDERAADPRASLRAIRACPKHYLDSADLRVTPGRFYKELLRDRGLTVGRLDARYTGTRFRQRRGNARQRPQLLRHRRRLYRRDQRLCARRPEAISPDRQYVTIGGVRDWDWRLPGGRDSDAISNVAPYIGKALRENSGLRVFVAQGWYDFATPFFGAEYSLTRTGIPTTASNSPTTTRPHDVRRNERPDQAVARHPRVHPRALNGLRASGGTHRREDHAIAAR